MHFVAMLAFMLPMPMSYDVGLTVLSLILAILAASAAFYVISRPGVSRLRLILGGVFMGIAIFGMHYTGMAAMRGPVELSYDTLWFALSVIFAIGAATAALLLAFRSTEAGQKLAAAIVMGLAISGMHFIGMRAAIFTAHAPPRACRTSSRSGGWAPSQRKAAWVLVTAAPSGCMTSCEIEAANSPMVVTPLDMGKIRLRLAQGLVSARALGRGGKQGGQIGEREPGNRQRQAGPIEGRVLVASLHPSAISPSAGYRPASIGCHHEYPDGRREPDRRNERSPSHSVVRLAGRRGLLLSPR